MPIPAFVYVPYICDHCGHEREVDLNSKLRLMDLEGLGLSHVIIDLSDGLPVGWEVGHDNKIYCSAECAKAVGG